MYDKYYCAGAFGLSPLIARDKICNTTLRLQKFLIYVKQYKHVDFCKHCSFYRVFFKTIATLEIKFA